MVAMTRERSAEKDSSRCSIRTKDCFAFEIYGHDQNRL